LTNRSALFAAINFLAILCADILFSTLLSQSETSPAEIIHGICKLYIRGKSASSNSINQF